MAPTGYVLRAARSTPRVVCAAIAIAIALGACGGAAPAPERPADAATRALVDRAHRAESARRYDRAARLFERARRAAPDDRSRAYASREYASSLVFWGAYERARAALEDAVALDPDRAGDWHDLGLLRHRAGDDAGAERALRRAISLRPDDPRPRVALAALLVRARRFAEARTAYRALLTLEIPDRTRRAIRRALELIAAERPPPP